MKNLSEIKSNYTLKAMIEALLFVAVIPISINQLSAALDESVRKIEIALEELGEHYKKTSGLRLQWKGNKVQLVSSPELAQLIEDFLGIETTTTLSQASLETMAIIAYKQPISRPMLEEVRGVNSDGVVRNLLSKGLIEEVGRADGIGRAILYGTTTDFLNHFGLSSISELPPFEIPSDISLDITGSQPRVLKD
ncbi:MAG: SMC-Scp complex subunit ScpB [Pelolinea sp.]|nr:SMC-Scp complex subunit ScpB [Pelolinea sp.]